MNVRQIETFRAVMEAGGVTAAAERLRITQPAVSKLIIGVLAAGVREIASEGGVA